MVKAGGVAETIGISTCGSTAPCLGLNIQKNLVGGSGRLVLNEKQTQGSDCGLIPKPVRFAMNATGFHGSIKKFSLSPTMKPSTSSSSARIEWDWDAEHADRKKEAKADAALHGAHPFLVDRKVLKDVVWERSGTEVARITFLSSGTFHKAYLITLADSRELVARVARNFMPRLKTESEVATMHYLREHTSIPVPAIFHYDSNPYNRLGGEYILMSKAPGISLSKVFHSMPHGELVGLLENIAALIIPLFSRRFAHLGSLYFDVPPAGSGSSSSAPTPKASQPHLSSFPFTSNLTMSSLSMNSDTPKQRPPRSKFAAAAVNTALASPEIHVGPIISWPFFGSNRGQLLHPTEINRGPWSNTCSYLLSCAEREINGVIRENEGKSAPHRLHLDPDEIISSRHHQLRAVPGDQSDDSDEWELEESEDEWEGPGDAMYRDYRRMQRSTFLVAHMVQREECVREETSRWIKLMKRLGIGTDGGGDEVSEEFGLDLHDLSLENVFVDEHDRTKITCIIDWESTTTRPLWACAHVPAFLQSSPFTADLFREIVTKLSLGESRADSSCDLPFVAREWLQHESSGTRLRLAHRFVEWDGWEEGLADSILGSEEHEDEWFRDCETEPSSDCTVQPQPSETSDESLTASSAGDGQNDEVPMKRRNQKLKLPFEKKEKERVLDVTGDICGGRGGELGRRLEAWLTVNGDAGEKLTGESPNWVEDEKAYNAESE